MCNVLTTPADQTPSPFPSFHDGYIVSITVVEKTATLGLRTSEGAAFELRLLGVEVFRADNFLEGNIVLELEVEQGSTSKRTYVDARLDHLFPPPHPSAASKYHAAHRDRLATAAERISNGEAALVSLEPTYGCELVALCSEVHLVAQL